MKDIFVRSITGVLFVAVLLGCIMWNQYSVACIFYGFTLLALNEFYKLMNLAGFTPHKPLGFLCGSLIYGLIAFHSFGDIPGQMLTFIFPILVLIVVVELFRKEEWPISNIAFTVLSMIYITAPFATLNYFAYYPDFNEEMVLYKNEYSLLLGFFIALWSNDTGAYLFGSMLGKNKLFERISPNKTWEGFIGGALLSVAGANIFAYFTESSHVHWSIIALIIVVFGTLGDLTESQIKRSIGVKDAGSFLPGHGGVLDRFDGVLYAAPFVLTYFLMLNLAP